MRDFKLFDRHVLTLVLALSLAACGGSNAVDPLEAATPFGPASTASPAGARDVPADELRALVAGGTPVTWLQADAMDAAVAAEQAAQAADEATLAASTDPTIAALRARTLIVGDGVTLLPSGDRSFSVESPQGSEAVVIQGDAWRRRALAQSAGALASRDNAMALYRQYRDALPEGVLADLPPADDLASLTDAAVQALVDLAAQRAVDVLSNESALPPDDAASASGSGSRRLAQGLSHRLQAPLASGCTHADDYSLYSDFDFALKNSLSAIRSQGKRGTCVAFATVAGLETQIRKAYGHSVDLSEQQLYAKAKGVWSPTANAFGDGLVAETVLPSLIASGLALRTEAAWAYNAARSRTEIGVAPGFYQKSCDGYGEACSDTNHEYGVACTTIATVKYCARLDPTAVTGGESYRLLAWGNLWRAAPPLTTLAIRASLAAGQPVAIGIDVDECLKYSSIWSKKDDGSWLQSPGNAYLNTQQYSCGSRGTNGTHEMLAVGYVSDAQMAARWSELPFHVASDEGGYFVVRNSWGCGAGDGGYVYISDYYLRTILLSASSIGPVLANYGSVSLQYTSSVPTGTDGIIRSPATVTLKANANSLVKRVAFYRQGPLVMTKLAEIQGNGTLTHAVSIDAGSNGNRVYFARGWDADGNLVSSNTVVVRVRIPGAPTVSLSASPTPAVAGQTLTLSAAAASSDGSAITQVQFMRGFTALATVTSPPFTTAVTLARGDTGNVGFVAVATNGNGYSTTSAPLIVTVKSGVKPTIDAFTVSPAVIGAPQVVTLAWTVSGADTLTLTGNPGNTLDVTGKSSQQLSQTQAATFTLTASNAAGST
ncbi:MAG: C1 family peptidase, partial [Caldimonas sp.]